MVRKGGLEPPRFYPPDPKLSRFGGVSEAGAARRSPAPQSGAGGLTPWVSRKIWGERRPPVQEPQGSLLFEAWSNAYSATVVHTRYSAGKKLPRSIEKAP